MFREEQGLREGEVVTEDGAGGGGGSGEEGERDGGGPKAEESETVQQ